MVETSMATVINEFELLLNQQIQRFGALKAQVQQPRSNWVPWIERSAFEPIENVQVLERGAR
jgi:hypothetical protein